MIVFLFLITILIAAIIGLGYCLITYLRFRKPKKANPDIKKMTIFNLIPVKGYSHHGGHVAFKNATDFIKYAKHRKDVAEVFAWTESCGYIFYFYYKNGCMFSLEIPRLVDK